MRNGKSKISLIAGVAALALVGTGYAAWQFSKDASVDMSGNVNIVAKDPEVGTLAIKAGQTVNLVLDQNEDGGVRWENDSGASISNIVVEYTGTDRVVNETIEVTMTPDYGAITTYVNFEEGTAPTSQTWTGGTTAIEFEFALPTVTYTDAYPLNETEYDEMVTALAGEKVTFTFEAAVAECTH